MLHCYILRQFSRCGRMKTKWVARLTPPPRGPPHSQWPVTIKDIFVSVQHCWISLDSMTACEGVISEWRTMTQLARNKQYLKAWEILQNKWDQKVYEKLEVSEIRLGLLNFAMLFFLAFHRVNSNCLMTMLSSHAWNRWLTSKPVLRA